IKNTLNPVWQAFKISVRALCNGDYDRHDFIGEFTTSYRELSRGQSQFNVYEVINPKKKGKKKKYVNSGTVTLLSFLIETEVSFLDYIKGGYVIGNKPFLFSQFHCNSLIICICTLHMMTLSSICKELYCFLILEAVLSYIKPADSY
uniref:C2 domain-containing protein n=1 Tax=Accipiter nisus TaxID=211598 RepID=A0A8B9LYF2_9AVES